LLVLAYHLWPTVITGGYVGVDVFFVISGYLITGLLLREIQQQGKIALSDFYLRRARRLLPAACTVLLFSAVFYPLLPYLQWQDLQHEVIASLLYLQNWFLANQATDYLTSAHAASPIQHYWSLAIEEQYYVLWPLLLVVAYQYFPGKHAAVRISLVLVVVTSLMYSIALSHSNQVLAHFSTGTRLWELGLGGLLAAFPRWHLLPGPYRLIIGWIGLGAILTAALLFDSTTVFPGYAALLPTVGSCLVIIAGDRKGFSASWLLQRRALQYIGDISYSLYLWHWPLIIYTSAFIGTSLDLQSSLSVFTLSILLAHLSKYYIEDRYRHAPEPGSSNFAFYRTTTILVLAIALSAFALHTHTQQLTHTLVTDNHGKVMAVPAMVMEARFDLPEAYQEKCFTSQVQSAPKLCHYGNPEADTTAVLIGDSHARQWLPALREVARLENLRLVAISKSACAYGSVPSLTKSGNPNISCIEWNNHVEMLVDDINPDILIYAQSLAYSTGAPSQHESAFALAEGLLQRWQAQLQMGKTVIAIKDSPRPGEDIPLCLSKSTATEHGCDKPRQPIIDIARRPDPLVIASAKLEGTHLIDMTDAICGKEFCPAQKNGQIVWRDAHHLTASFVRSIAPQLHEKFRPILSDAGFSQ
jgi:peptidoglycan/LPS O-acetylase OafA/YrhL